VLTIDRDSQIFLAQAGEHPRSSAEDCGQPGVNPDKQVIYLRADERVPFGAFAHLMDAVKLAGITNISIVTQPLDTKGRAGNGSSCWVLRLVRDCDSQLPAG